MPKVKPGGQIDAYYSIRGDKQRNDYWNFHANFSTFYSDKDLTGESRLLWRDINADVEHQWNKRWKTAFSGIRAGMESQPWYAGCNLRFKYLCTG